MKRTLFHRSAHCYYQFGAVICLLFVLLSAHSCSSFNEARVVIASADSLDRQYMLYSDTAQLKKTIATLNTPIGRTFERTALSKAYYYLGRIYDDSLHYIYEATECYIACDRLRADDDLHRGRANTCMAYICMFQNANEAALTFCQRANDLFNDTPYTWYYAHSLLNMCSSFLELGYIAEADSILRIAETYSLDSAYIGRLSGLCGALLYARQEYDSALIELERAFEYPISVEQQCFYNIKRMQVYSALQKPDSALYYAHFVEDNTDNVAFLAEAYGTIISYAQQNDDAQTLRQYVPINQKNNRILRDNEGKYAVSIKTLKEYIQKPHPFLPWQIAVTILIIISVFCLAVNMIIHKRQKEQIEIQHTMIETQEKQLKQQQQTHQKQINQITRVNAETAVVSTHKISEFLSKVNDLHNQYPSPKKEWINNYPAFKRDVSVPFAMLIGQLENLSLSEKEIYSCVYTLLYKGVTANEMAEYLFYSPSGIRTFKQRVSHKLGTTGAALYDTLLCMALND